MLLDGVLDDPAVAREVESSLDFFYVEKFYAREIEQGVVPTDDDVRAFFDAHAASYTWRPDLDVVFFAADSVGVLEEVRERLSSGVSFPLLREAYAYRDSSLVAGRTGLKRSFPDVPGLEQAARSLGDRKGAVSAVMPAGRKKIVARIEEVGQPSPMTFADAYEMALEACTALMRENRLRSILDSLRTELGVEIDAAKARRAISEMVGS